MPKVDLQDNEEPTLDRAALRHKLQELADRAYDSDMALAFVDVMSRGGRRVRVSITFPKKKKAK